jgi:beta-phosphoglucomutase
MSRTLLRAIIFDCDGVIADTEPLHLAAFQRVLGEEGIDLTDEEYYREYLALDDRACFLKVFQSRARALDAGTLGALIERKAGYIEPAMREGLRLFPGAAALIREAAGGYRVAVASGALRREVELVLEHGRLRGSVEVIVAAEDVARSKPHPDPFLKALSLLNAGSAPLIEPAQCLVVEDSVHGVEAAHAAGMLCLAVTNSYTSERLGAAEVVVSSLEEVSLGEVEVLLARRGGR